MPRSARSIICIAWLRSVVLLALVGGVAVACSSGAPAVSPTARPEAPKVTLVAAATAAPTSSTYPSAAATPVPTAPAYPIATPTATLVPVVQSPLQLAQRVDALHGWALVAHQLRWTDDDGAHWRTIAVPLAEQQSIANAFFFDTHNGWLLIAGPDDAVKLTAQFSILRTLASSAEPANFIRFMFANDVQGWGVALKPGCGGNCAVLMRTRDSGYDWETIDVNR